MHLSELELRAYHDKELTAAESSRIAEHLKDCNECAQQMKEIGSRAGRVAAHFYSLRSQNLTDLQGESILQKINQRRVKTSVKSKWAARLRPAWIAAVAAAIVVVFAWQSSSVRAMASEFLSLFRVQQIAVVQIDPANVQRLQNEFFDERHRPALQQLFSDNAHVVKQGEPREVADVNEAARVAGFGVRLPGQLSGQPRLRVQPGVDISFTLDVERMQGLLDEAGRSDIRIPEEADGKTVNLNIPASVTAFYGDCPDPEKMKEQSDDDDEPRKHVSYPQCKVIAQVPSPTVIAPPTLNIVQLGQAMLQFFGFTPEQAQKFSEQVDWTSTLVLPVPTSRGVVFKEVTVDGVKANLLTSDEEYSGGSPSYNLIWLRDGILYSAMGHGTADEALAIADSMH